MWASPSTSSNEMVSWSTSSSEVAAAALGRWAGAAIGLAMLLPATLGILAAALAPGAGRRLDAFYARFFVAPHYDYREIWPGFVDVLTGADPRPSDDLPERVIPAEHLNARPLDRIEAFRHLLLLAARHHGVGTAADLADYYRLHRPTARRVLTDIVAAGELEEVTVAGWSQPAYLHPEATLPRRISTCSGSTSAASRSTARPGPRRASPPHRRPRHR